MVPSQIPRRPTNSAFATELTRTSLWAKPVVLLAFGHTHWSCDFERDGIRVVGNQRGTGLGGQGFDASKVIVIDQYVRGVRGNTFQKAQEARCRVVLVLWVTPLYLSRDIPLIRNSSEQSENIIQKTSST